MPTRIVSATTFLGILLLSAPVALAQTSTTTKPPAPKPNTAPPTTTFPRQQDRRPIFLTGKVKLDDGTEPSERIAIERVCNGRVRREAYTDAHGSFGFQLGQNLIMQDASVGSTDLMRGMGVAGSSSGSGSAGLMTPGATVGITPQELMGCELRASLPGYLSESINLAGHQVFDSPDVGILMLHRVGKVEGTKVSMTTLQAPGDAKKALRRARHALEKKKLPEAQEQLEKAVSLFPRFAEAQLLLGEVYSAQGHADRAEQCYRAAIDADAHFVEPYHQLAVLAGRRSDWKTMADLSAKALQLDAYEYPAIYLVNAIANYNLHNLDAAEKSARAGRKLDSQYKLPRLDFLLANVLVRRGDNAGAAAQLQSFLKYSPTGKEADEAREMLDQTQKIASRTAAQPK